MLGLELGSFARAMYALRPLSIPTTHVFLPLSELDETSVLTLLLLLHLLLRVAPVRPETLVYLLPSLTKTTEASDIGLSPGVEADKYH